MCTSNRLILPILLLCLTTFADKSDSLLGKWYTEKEESIFTFYKEGDEFAARLTPLKFPNIIDSLNPDSTLKSRKLKDVKLIWGLKYNPKKDRYEDGKVYNPENGKIYSCNCKVKEGKLRFHGYIGIAALGQTKIWLRVDNDTKTK